MNLIEYIKGLRRGKDAHRLEKESMRDPFLFDAIEGFDSVGGDHASRIDDMRRKITARSKTRRKSNNVLLWSSAAAVLLLVGIGGYLLTVDRQGQMMAVVDSKVAEEQEIIQEEISDIETEKSQSERKYMKEEDSKKDRHINPATPHISESIAIANNDHHIVEETAFESEDVKALVDKQPKTAISASEAKAKTEVEKSQDAAKENAAESKKMADVGKSDAKRAETGDPDELLGNEEALMEQVVVVGYGKQRKESMTGSISKIETSKTKEKPIPVSQPVNGEKAFDRYVKRNMVRPDDTTKGDVTLEFKIDDKGRPYEIKVISGINESFDKEAIRLINQGPDWKKADEQPVRKVIKF